MPIDEANHADTNFWQIHCAGLHSYFLLESICTIHLYLCGAGLHVHPKLPGSYFEEVRQPYSLGKRRHEGALVAFPWMNSLFVWANAIDRISHANRRRHRGRTRWILFCAPG